MLEPVLEKLGLDDTQRRAFYKLLQLTDIIDDEFDDTQFEDATAALDWLKAVTQKHWLRKEGTERWNLKDSADMQRNTELREILTLLDLLAERTPSKTEYEYALLQGALQSRVETRMDYLIALWGRGIRCNQIVVLGGQRPLMKDREPLATTLSEGATEFDMMMEVIAASRESWPDDMKKFPIIEINTPMQTKPEGGTRRPNTADTFRHWQEEHKPEPGSVLAISNQPYVDYQHAVARAQLPDAFSVETVGHTASKHELNSVILDSIARRIYAGYARLKKALVEEPKLSGETAFFSSEGKAPVTSPTDPTDTSTMQNNSE